MSVSPVTRNFFSEKRKNEITLRWVSLAVFAALVAVLLIYWEPLRTQAFMTAMAEWRPPLLKSIFKGITMIGDDIGHMAIILVIFWCINKSIGFSAMMVLLFSAIYMYVFKGFFAEPRPLEGQAIYDDLSFPSGHTLTTFAVWGYLAMRFRNKTFWIVAVAVAVLVGMSRVIIGVHFPGDIIGGFIFGAVFLAIVYWLGGLFAKREGSSSFTISLPVKVIGLVALFTAISVRVVMFKDFRDATMVTGFLAGLIIGFVLEKALVGFETKGKWYQHLLKVVIGLGVVFFVAKGAEMVFADAAFAETVFTCPIWRIIQYAFAGLWVTFLAPLIFVATGLAAREEKKEQ